MIIPAMYFFKYALCMCFLHMLKMRYTCDISWDQLVRPNAPLFEHNCHQCTLWPSWTRQIAQIMLYKDLTNADVWNTEVYTCDIFGLYWSIQVVQWVLCLSVKRYSFQPSYALPFTKQAYSYYKTSHVLKGSLRKFKHMKIVFI